MVGRGGAAAGVIRVLVEPGSLDLGQAVVLDRDEVHHLRVRRAVAGELVIAYDGAGGIGRGTLEGSAPHFEVQVAEVTRTAPPPPLVLAVAAGDRDRYLRMAEQCTELGVTDLVPLVTERARSVESRIRDGALPKAWRRAREACKQSGNPWATVVAPFTTLAELAALRPGMTWLLADPDGEPLPAGDLGAAGCGWLIGPEGGFTPEESAVARDSLGARRIWLAAHILRFETAAALAAGLIIDRRRALPGRES